MEFRICIKGSLRECLSELRDRGIKIAGIDKCIITPDSWLFDIDILVQDLDDWLRELECAPVSDITTSILVSANVWTGQTVALPATDELWITEYVMRQTSGDDDDCPDCVNERVIEHKFDDLLQLIEFICTNTVETSCSPLGKGHDLSNYQSYYWFIGDSYVDFQGLSDGSEIYSTYHIKSLCPSINRIIAYAYENRAS